MSNNKSIILLSGGLDSVVSLALTKEELNITLALTFDYGQKSVNKEIKASKEIADFYGIEHKVIKLDWLKGITKTSLVSEEEIPTGKKLNNLKESAKSVWVPNRNGLFLNIAGAFADADDYTNIIIGANKEEAQTFPDNTKDFIERVNAEFEYSTRVQPKVSAPLIECDKVEIVRLALLHKAPLHLLNSCYKNTEKHCGVCESCVRLKRALEANNDSVYIKQLFEE